MGIEYNIWSSKRPDYWSIDQPKPQTTLFVTWSFTGFHSYPAAPSDVHYLTYKHRHTFNIYIELDVNPEVDRELEFHQIINNIKPKFEHVVDDQDTGSCETMCKQLDSIITTCYPNRSFHVVVNEDNECGATRTKVVMS